MSFARYKTYYPGAYYHIFNRGVAKQPIFADEHDYYQYLKRLRRFRDDHRCTILCYCLMPNHLHLLVRQNHEPPVAKFIQSLHTSYSMYFNRRHNRVGPLFQDRFKSKLIDGDSYLLHVSRYIHANPVVSGIAERLEDYPWSSYPDYIGQRFGELCDKAVLIISGQSSTSPRTVLKGGVMSAQAYREFVLEIIPTLKDRKRVEHDWEAYLKGELDLREDKKEDELANEANEDSPQAF